MTRFVHSRIDTDDRAAVITTSFDHPTDVVWGLFSDPAKLARWWGPPGLPMTVDHHDLRPGGAVLLTVSTGDAEIHGRWDIHEVDAPHRLRFTFSSDGLEPTEVTVRLDAESDRRTALRITARFSSDDLLRHALDIGFVDGVARAVATAHDAVTGS
jgi:uncharacterized protein YndB with AHSA1/START domain